MPSHINLYFLSGWKTKLLLKERKREMLDTLNEMLAQSTVYLNGTEHQVSSTSDGKTKVIYAFQDLVKLAYSKLKMLGDMTFDEKRLLSIMKGRQDDLFGEDDASMTPPEKEVMNFIQRRKKMNERTTLTNLKDQFSQKPYGWPDFAIWYMVAMLFKRGKIIAKQDSNIIEDSEFESALMNNRSHANTLVYHQIEFDQGQVRKLKKIHQYLFNESNPLNEAKDAATLFKEKGIDELETVSNLIAQKKSYPFMEQLQPMADKLRNIKEMDYATLVTEIGSMEGELLDVKEDNLDPIKQFMNSGQRNIYDRLNQFDSYNQANFDYVDAHEKEVLQKAKENPTPYRGPTMREAKEAMDALEKRVKIELKGEKNATIEHYKEAIEDLKQRDEFTELSNSQKKQLIAPLIQELNKAENERFIGNLRDQRNRLSNHLFTNQLNLMIELAQPEEDDGEEEKPKRKFIKESNIHTSFSKKELETEEDVDDYLKALRKSMIDHINKNHNILLD